MEININKWNLLGRYFNLVKFAMMRQMKLQKLKENKYNFDHFQKIYAEKKNFIGCFFGRESTAIHVLNFIKSGPITTSTDTIF